MLSAKSSTLSATSRRAEGRSSRGGGSGSGGTSNRAELNLQDILSNADYHVATRCEMLANFIEKRLRYQYRRRQRGEASRASHTPP